MSFLHFPNNHEDLPCDWTNCSPCRYMVGVACTVIAEACPFSGGRGGTLPFNMFSNWLKKALIDYRSHEFIFLLLSII